MVDEARRYTIAYGAGLEAQRLGILEALWAGHSASRHSVFWKLPRRILPGGPTLFRSRRGRAQFRAAGCSPIPRLTISLPQISLYSFRLYLKKRETCKLSIPNGPRDRCSSRNDCRAAVPCVYRIAYRHVIATESKNFSRRDSVIQPEHRSSRNRHEPGCGTIATVPPIPAAGILKTLTLAWQ